MSKVKTKATGKYFSALWIISITFIVDAAYGKIGSNYPSSELTTLPKPFEDLKVEAVVYSENESLLILKITWSPKMTNDSIFRAIVNTIEGGKCLNGLCDEHGLISHNATIFIPTKPTSPGTSHAQCRIDPGCNYTIIVENPNFESEITYTVPDCVGNVCSCQHELPLVKTSADIHSQIMTIRWEIDGSYIVPRNISIYIAVIITNINDFKNELKVFNHTLTSPKEHSGEFKWKVPVNGVDYLTRTFVYDSHNCIGSAPSLAKAKGKQQDKHPTQIKWLIIAAVSFVVMAPIAWFIYKSKAKEKPPKRKPPIPSIKNPDYPDWRSRVEMFMYFNIVDGQLPSNVSLRLDWAVAKYYNSLKFDHIIGYSSLRNGSRHTIASQVLQLVKAAGIKFSQIGKFLNCSDSKFQDEIDHSNLQLIKIIGEGAFGTVHIAKHRFFCGKPDFQIVAVKQLKRQPSEEQKQEFFSEIQMMKTVSRHPNIVALLGYCTEREPLQIVMEYVSCGDLKAYLYKLRERHEERYGRNRVTIPCEPNHPLLAPPSGRYLDLMNSSATSTSDSSRATEANGTILRPSVTETEYTTLSNNDDITSMNSSLEYVLDHRELHNFARQIAEGMKHLHHLKITHRDLAARNILIDERKTLKISDFGLSRSGIYVKYTDKPVPLRWLSIEAMGGLYTEKSDVWAFGVVLWEIGALGGQPYHMVSNKNLPAYLSAGNRLEKPENCSNYLYDLMTDCWAARPDDRPDFSKILSRLVLHEAIYVDFSELSSDYVFPPTKEQIENNKSSNGLRH